MNKAKIALTDITEALSGAVSSGGSIVYTVAYGNANAPEGSSSANNATSPSNTTAIKRDAAGGSDANVNSTDCTMGTLDPRNFSSPLFLSRLKIDVELEVESLTPIRPLRERLACWKEITVRSLGLEAFTIGENDHRQLILIRDFKPDAIVHFTEQRAAPDARKTGQPRWWRNVGA